MDRKKVAIGLGTGAVLFGVIYLVTRGRAEGDGPGPGPGPGEKVNFSVIAKNIPDYAGDSYQWYVSYGGQYWGMIDPQGGVWTPINEKITLEDVPAAGTLTATLMAGAYKSWVFRINGPFEDGKEYPLDLVEGTPGAGVSLINLLVEPVTFHLSESATITVTAINEENTSMHQEVVFTVNGSEVGSEMVTLSPGERRDVSIEVTPSEIGVYTVQVGMLNATFEVIVLYPDIAEPKIKSIAWLPSNQWSSGYPAFKGTILLPDPGITADGYVRWYTIAGRFSGALYEGGVELTYLSAGLWSFEGGGFWPSERNVCDGIRKMYQGNCPACGRYLAQGDVMWGPEHLRARIYNSHVVPMCGSTNPTAQAHCAVRQADIPIWEYDYPQQYEVQGPCTGTRMNLTLHIYLLEHYISGIYSGTRAFKEWIGVSTGLYLVSDYGHPTLP